MKKHLLSGQYRSYKANLHCHSTFSDGRYDVATLKKIYKQHGYGIVAFSDHNVLVPHNELCDEDFLPINATEIDINGDFGRTYHLNFFCFDKDRTELPLFERVYSVDGVNKLISVFNDNGFLCQYNHPRWSFQTTSDFTGLKGLWGFEVFNTGCEVEMHDGWGDYEYEVMCRDSGELPVAVATDDNHNGMTDDPDGALSDSFGGWLTVFAKALTYEDVFDALKKGDCYATTGPEISELYIENGKVFIKCTPASSVCIRFESRRADRVRSLRDDITEACFDVSGDFDHFRIEVKNSSGGKAMTRAYGKKALS